MAIRRWKGKGKRPKDFCFSLASFLFHLSVMRAYPQQIEISSSTLPRPEKKHQLRIMLLQRSSVDARHVNPSPSFSCSRNLLAKASHLTLIEALEFQKLSVTCFVSQIHGCGTVHHQRSGMKKWHANYKKKLSRMTDLGTLLNKLETGGRKVTKEELSKVVEELRKINLHRDALEVYDWMNNRGERFGLSASDAAIQLELIVKVRGVSNAEVFFLKLPETLKDRETYGALLNAYVNAKMIYKAESLFEKMRDKGYAAQPFTFNVMMTLYMKFKEYDKVGSMVQEMKQKKIPLDLCSYNIWLFSLGSQGCVEKMEQVYEEMKADRSINPHWTTFSTLATIYIKMGLVEKAEECLSKFESLIITRSHQTPYHYLIRLYGIIGNKEEVHRTWKVYKSIFPSVQVMGYYDVISSLVRVGDIEVAENIYEEWRLVKSAYDIKIVNLMMSAFVRKGNMDKVESLFNQMVEAGGKPNPSSLMVLAEGHIKEKRISEALSCMKKAFAINRLSSWTPHHGTVSAFFDLCEEEADTASKEVLVALLRQSGILKIKSYASLVGLSDETVTDNELLKGKDRSDGKGGREIERLMRRSLAYLMKQSLKMKN